MGLEPPAGITIQPASDADKPELATLLPARELESVTGLHRPPRFLVAKGPEGVVGAVAMEIFGGDGYLRSLCVHPRFEGHALGRALVERSLTDAALEALDAVYLTTGNATHLFAEFGFVPIDRTDLPSAVRRAIELSGMPPAVTCMKLALADR